MRSVSGIWWTLCLATVVLIWYGTPAACRCVHAGEGLVERARPAEDVVGGRVRAVEADADAADAALPDAPRHVGVDQRAVGRQRDNQARVGGVTGDVEDVGPEERLAAGEHEDRPGEGRDLVDQTRTPRPWSGPAAASWSATVMRRQWMQARLQPAVVSQKISRGDG